MCQDPVFGKHMGEEQLHYLRRIDHVMGGYEYCLLGQLTTMRMAENPLEAGSCSMKSIEMEDHGLDGIGNCFSFP